ncbi:hypothetical protein [Longibaculum muris]|uniref:hypothetical protein n=1 Tax=Longibaculum muris TaxID=1796628 RepID=UPI0012B810F3|nr:hypothetical protein [Longibaculum muris]
MKKMNERGSTIVTGIVIVLIIFIILGTALAIATSYQKRSINEHARKQAYLNAVSVADGIAGQLNNIKGYDVTPTPSGQGTKFLPKKGQPIEITSVKLPDNAGGTVTAKIILDDNDENTIYIQVTSTYARETVKLQLTTKKMKKENKNSELWYRIEYKEDVF